MILNLKTYKEFEALKNKVKFYKNNFRFMIANIKYCQFGCEIEFNSEKEFSYHNKNNINYEYEVTIDGSGDDVIEIISPILKNCKRDWLSMKEVLNNIDGTIKSTVGGHIHFDHSIIDDKNLVNFLKLWYSFEDTIYNFSCGEFKELREKHNYYAKRLDEKLKNHIDNYEEGLSDFEDFGYFDKYYGLNMGYHLYLSKYVPGIPDTYEIRIPNGSLDINIWQNNVEFFASLFKFANDPLHSIFINDIYKKGKLEDNLKNRVFLSNFIFQNDDSKYRFLNQFYLDKELPIGTRSR